MANTFLYHTIHVYLAYGIRKNTVETGQMTYFSQFPSENILSIMSQPVFHM